MTDINTAAAVAEFTKAAGAQIEKTKTQVEELGTTQLELADRLTQLEQKGGSFNDGGLPTSRTAPDVGDLSIKGLDLTALREGKKQAQSVSVKSFTVGQRQH